MPLSPSNTGSPPSRPCCPFHCEQILHHPSFFVLRDSDSETRKYVSDWLSLGHMILSTSIIFLSLTLTHCSILSLVCFSAPGPNPQWPFPPGSLALWFPLVRTMQGSNSRQESEERKKPGCFSSTSFLLTSVQE